MRSYPGHWKRQTVGNLFEVQLGKMLNSSAKEGVDQLPYLTNFNIQWGRFELSKLNTMHFTTRERQKFSLRFGDLLICEGGEVGRCAIWKSEISPCYYQKAIHRLRARDGTIIPEYMMAFMRSIAGTKVLGDLTSRSSIAHLTREKLVELSVVVPPLDEQRSITQILDAGDELIEQHQFLIAAKVDRKRGLMHQLLTGKKRFKEFAPERWRSIQLSDIAAESNLRNNGKLDREFLMAVTKAEGIIPMRDRVQGESLDRCKIVRPGWFAYNPMRINIGSIAQWKGDHDVMVSGDYVVFHCNPGELDHRWLDQFRRTHRWESFVRRSGNGSVRVRIWFSDLGRLSLKLPAIEEQRRIAEVLETCDREVELLKKQLEALKAQKRGLMQKLLTGAIRVIC